MVFGLFHSNYNIGIHLNIMGEKLPFQIHGVISSDSDSDGGSKTYFDEEYNLLKPPPLMYENIKSSIVKISPKVPETINVWEERQKMFLENKVNNQNKTETDTNTTNTKKKRVKKKSALSENMISNSELTNTNQKVIDGSVNQGNGIQLKTAVSQRKRKSKKTTKGETMNVPIVIPPRYLQQKNDEGCEKCSILNNDFRVNKTIRNKKNKRKETATNILDKTNTFAYNCVEFNDVNNINQLYIEPTTSIPRILKKNKNKKKNKQNDVNDINQLYIEPTTSIPRILKKKKKKKKNKQNDVNNINQLYIEPTTSIPRILKKNKNKKKKKQNDVNDINQLYIEPTTSIPCILKKNKNKNKNKQNNAENVLESKEFVKSNEIPNAVLTEFGSQEMYNIKLGTRVSLNMESKAFDENYDLTFRNDVSNQVSENKIQKDRGNGIIKTNWSDISNIQFNEQELCTIEENLDKVKYKGVWHMNLTDEMILKEEERLIKKENELFKNWLDNMSVNKDQKAKTAKKKINIKKVATNTPINKINKHSKKEVEMRTDQKINITNTVERKNMIDKHLKGILNKDDNLSKQCGLKPKIMNKNSIMNTFEILDKSYSHPFETTNFSTEQFPNPMDYESETKSKTKNKRKKKSDKTIHLQQYTPTKIFSDIFEVKKQSFRTKVEEEQLIRSELYTTEKCIFDKNKETNTLETPSKSDMLKYIVQKIESKSTKQNDIHLVQRKEENEVHKSKMINHKLDKLKNERRVFYFEFEGQNFGSFMKFRETYLFKSLSENGKNNVKDKAEKKDIKNRKKDVFLGHNMVNDHITFNNLRDEVKCFYYEFDENNFNHFIDFREMYLCGSFTDLFKEHDIFEAEKQSIDSTRTKDKKEQLIGKLDTTEKSKFEKSNTLVTFCKRDDMLNIVETTEFKSTKHNDVNLIQCKEENAAYKSKPINHQLDELKKEIRVLYFEFEEPNFVSFMKFRDTYLFKELTGKIGRNEVKDEVVQKREIKDREKENIFLGNLVDNHITFNNLRDEVKCFYYEFDGNNFHHFIEFREIYLSGSFTELFKEQRKRNIKTNSKIKEQNYIENVKFDFEINDSDITHNCINETLNINWVLLAKVIHLLFLLVAVYVVVIIMNKITLCVLDNGVQIVLILVLSIFAIIAHNSSN